MNAISGVDSTDWKASAEDQAPANYPELYNLSAAFVYRFIARPVEPAPPEFLYVPFVSRGKRLLEMTSIMGTWNLGWEQAQLRSEVSMVRKDWMQADLSLPALELLKDRNVYLLPNTKKRFDAYLPLYAMLPAHLLERFGLPAVRRMVWPTIAPQNCWHIEPHLPADFRERVSRAFASYIWPLIDGGSSLQAFHRDEPLKLLAHNLEFWLPHAVRVAERRLRQYDFVEFEDDKARLDLARIQEAIAADEPVTIGPCRMGGPIWIGEDDAREAAIEMLDAADCNGHLRSVVEAIRSNRVEEDFSDRWSFAREDFERKLYRKRSRVRVKFVELDEAAGVVGPDSEIFDRQIWQDFFALLDAKERQIVVCLWKAGTNLSEAARELGYANHSPVSKALARIRKKAEHLLCCD